MFCTRMLCRKRHNYSTMFYASIPISLHVSGYSPPSQVPLYIAEMAPPSHRGFLVVLNNVFIVGDIETDLEVLKPRSNNSC